MSRMTKTLQSVKQNVQHLDEASPDLSSIEKDSIFQEDLSNSEGNPLHSTALEDDFRPVHTQQKMTPAIKVGTQTKARSTETPVKRLSSVKKGKKKGSQKLSSVFKTPSVQPLTVPSSRVLPKSKAKPLRKISEKNEIEEMSASDSGQKTSQGPSLAGKQKPARKSSGKVPMQEISEEKEMQRGFSAAAEDLGADSDSLTDEASDYTPPSKRKNQSVENTQEEESSIEAGGQKKSHSTPGSRQKQSRKSSSGSSDAGAQVKRRKRRVRNPIDLEVVQEAFQDFVEQYKETVDSSAVQMAIDHLSESFVDQLNEAITGTRELSTVKKENIKLNIAINRKRSKLVDAKNELAQSEAKLRVLEREHEQLKQRLSDLTKGMSLLSGLTDLHSKYLTHCETHPKEPPVYDPTSLPALLLEARCMLGAEQQLKTINRKLQQVLGNVDQ